MEELEATIVSVRDYLTDSSREDWFKAVADSYTSAADTRDWQAFSDELTAAAGQAGIPNDVLETFTQAVLQTSDTWDILSQMAYDVDATMRTYDELAEAGSAESEAEEVIPWDDGTAAQWYLYVASESGTGGWSGDDSDWDQFRQSFQGYADDAGATGQARVFLDRIESHPAGKVFALTELGITVGSGDYGYDESTGLYYDEEGNRYQKDSAGQFHQLIWTDSELYWVNIDRVDYWYDSQFEPYVVPEPVESDDTAQAAQDAQAAQAAPAQPVIEDVGYAPPPDPQAQQEGQESETDGESTAAVQTIVNDVAGSLMADHAELVEQLGNQEVFEQLVAEVLRERVAAAR